MPFSVMAGLVWGLLSIGFRAFFARLAAGRDRVPRPAPAVRSLGQRKLPVREAVSWPKPPEAVAEGQPLRGFPHRRPSPGEIEGPRACPSAAPFFDPRWGPSKRVAHFQPRRLRCCRHETAPYARRFGWVRSGPRTHTTDRRGGGVRR